MYLKEIKAQGFKSFADLTTIEFNNGVTGIVGPNGSGKSNVVDAIRWVLGEQSVKSLRGDSSMTDVIFSGSKSRKESNIASVTLIFDNSDNYIPLDLKEISVKRKVYKDGTNEYFLNNEQCRLKDITDILLDSGVAKESFNIISQGKIEEILSTKPGDRRVVFEEAAGVLKYKKRKEEALRKLSKTNDNLKRVEDIISEVETQLEPLKEEREKALIYIDCSEQLKNIEIALLAMDIDNINEKYQENKQKIDILNNEIVKITTSNTTDETSILEEKKQLDKLVIEIDKLQKELLEVTSNSEKLNSQKKILLERKKYEVDDQKLHNNLVDLKEKELSIKNTISKIKDNISSKTEELSQYRNLNNNFIIEINKLKENKQKIETNLTNTLKENHILKNKIERLKDSIDNNGLLPASVSTVLNNPKLRGIKGVIGGVIETEEQYSTAITIALGASANNIIVDDELCAKEAINYLKNNSLGRVTFFPLNIIKPRAVEENVLTSLQKEKGFINVADKLVKYDKAFYNVIKNQLGNVLIVDNLDNANIISKKLNQRYKIVTLEGDLLHIGGSVTGGKQKTYNIINEKFELEKAIKENEKLNNNIKEYEDKINEVDYKLKETEDKHYLNNKEILNLETALKLLNDTEKNENEKYQSITSEIKGVNDIMNNTLSTEEENLINAFFEEERKKDEISHKLNETIKQRDIINSSIEEKEYQFKKQNSEFLEKSNSLKNLEIEVNRMDVKLDNLLNYLNETYNMTFEYAKANFKLEIEEKEARQKVSNLKSQLKEIGYVNLNAPELYNSVSERYDFLTNQKEDLFKAETTLLTIISELDEVMKKDFIETFNIIHDHFKRIFKELFKGGSAHLKLTEPDNILETGIEIIAEPPGKKLSSINLLSGGEKTFTAISLLFAILNSREVPFCIFDEVEAALDEVNVEAFGEYLMKLKEKTQFILITHKKKTMEYVDLLYGITMQESGISKLVSVRLEELNN